jgi:hypothetical protein
MKLSAAHLELRSSNIVAPVAVPVAASVVSRHALACLTTTELTGAKVWNNTTAMPARQNFDYVAGMHISNKRPGVPM